jgi:NAD(P)-dependent dehydrogenase (short-subunit alcohol dehydrogenase family)
MSTLFIRFETQLAINHFLKKDASSANDRPKKHILQLTSIARHMPVFVGPLYSATKHGISVLVQSLAPLDDQLNIRVVGIAPGITATPI